MDGCLVLLPFAFSDFETNFLLEMKLLGCRVTGTGSLISWSESIEPWGFGINSSAFMSVSGEDLAFSTALRIESSVESLLELS